ncbi:MAG: metallophosphoesterase [Prevotella sp.]|nr:metallophosphoesterase [Prevotella sp.]
MDTTLDLKSAKRNMLIILLVIAASLLLNITANAQTPEQWKTLKGDVNLFIANDLGRNGYYEQKPIAELMGVMGETIGPEAVVAAGDVHHFEGVVSTQDPLWMTNYELIYSHPELMITWLPVLGNHEYRGNTQAVLDYRNISRRWEMEGRYYTKVYDDNGVSIRLVLIDTTPFINRYHNSSTYPDVDSQDIDAQLKWIDKTLNEATEDWVIVAGHHPMYADTKKDLIEQKDMQERLLPILQRYKSKVAMYVCGHIHNFQHIRRGNDGIDYVVNSSASLARKVNPTEGTIFCSPAEGFSVVSATKKQLNLYMIDKKGEVIHKVEKTKK